MAVQVVGIVLAAGRGRRMGRTKQLLAWGRQTVLGQTIQNARAARLSDIVVVTGHEREAVTAVAEKAGVATIFNPRYAQGEMLSSLQCAIRHLDENGIQCDAVLVILGDQPLVESTIFNQLVAACEEERSLVAPVFEGRRGNPVLIGAAYFSDLLAIPEGGAPRDLLRANEAALKLLAVESESVLIDLDRPEQYERYRPVSNQ